MHPNEAVLKRFGQAIVDGDYEALASCVHPDWRWEMPQSGEVFIGMDNFIAMRARRPDGEPRIEPIRYGGEGDTWWSEGIVHYGDGSRWLALGIVEFRDGLVAREIAYFMQPVQPQPWRARWAVQEKAAIS